MWSFTAEKLLMINYYYRIYSDGKDPMYLSESINKEPNSE